MRKIHYCDDFVLEFRRRDGKGDVVALPSHDWRAVLHTISNYRYQCWIVESKSGELRGNAEVKDDGRILLFVLNNHGLEAGRLVVEWYEDIPDSHFSDGYRHIHRTYKTDVELVRGQGDEITVADVEVVMPYIIPSLDGYALKTDVDVLGSNVDSLISDVNIIRTDFESLSRNVEVLSENIDKSRILEFDAIVESLSEVSARYEGMIVFVGDEGRFRKYQHDSWNFDTLVSPYNISQHGITIVNFGRLFKLSTTGSIYRKSKVGQRLESVAWSDDFVTQDQLMETTDSLTESIGDLRNEILSDVVREVLNLEKDLATPELVEATYSRIKKSVESNQEVFVAIIDGVMVVPGIVTLDSANNQIVVSYTLNMKDTCYVVICSDGTVQGSEVSLVDEIGLSEKANKMIVDKTYLTTTSTFTGGSLQANRYYYMGYMDVIAVGSIEPPLDPNEYWETIIEFIAQGDGMNITAPKNYEWRDGVVPSITTDKRYRWHLSRGMSWIESFPLNTSNT